MTPLSPKRDLQYKLTIVTYLDIIGFRELIISKSPNFISRAIRRLQEETKSDYGKEYKSNYVPFSDLVIHTLPVETDANKKYRIGPVHDRILHVCTAQAVLISDEGLLLRGAITLGGMERSYGVIFGPALIAAYELERKKPHLPCVVIESQMLSALKTNPILRRHEYTDEAKYLRDLTRKDEKQNFVFADYLGAMQTQVEASDYSYFMRRHKLFIEKRLSLYKRKPRILSKYEWLRQYHNEVVSERFTNKVRQTLAVAG